MTSVKVQIPVRVARRAVRTRRVLECERDELGQELLQSRTWISWEFDHVEPLKESSVAVGEHGVIERQLRVEVGVERRLAHPDLTGQGVQRHPNDPVLSGELPRRLDDRGHFGLSSLRDLVRLERRVSARSLAYH